MRAALRLFLAMALLLAAALPGGCGAGGEPVTLRYAAWNLGNPEANGLERLMVQAFMETHPNVRIKIDERFTADYDGAMASASADGALPDVFMYASIPQASANGWCADLTGLALADGEWGAIPAPIREAVQVGGRTAAIPSAMHFYGYFCNASLFEARGVPVPEAGFTMEEFLRAANATTDAGGRTVGLAETGGIIDWYPAAANGRLGWYSWDGGKFCLDSSAFIAGVRLAQTIHESGCAFSALSEEDRQRLGYANDWEAWCAGAVAMKFDGTWAAGDWAKLGFDVRFLGLPGGRVCIVPDFLFISKSCGHPAEAYEFARFMSAYSREGFAERMRLAAANGLAVGTLPMVKDRKLIDAFFGEAPASGIRAVYDSMKDMSYVEGTKVLPGYSQARWEYVTSIPAGETCNAKIGDVLSCACMGAVDIDEVAALLNSAASECVQIYPKPAGN